MLQSFKFLLSSFILFLSMSLIGQDTAKLNYLKNYQDSIHARIKNISSIRGNNKREHNLYLNKAWQNCVLVTQKDEILYFNGRYSVLDHAIQWKRSDDIGVIYPGQIKSAMVGAYVLVPFKVGEIDGVHRPTYLEILSEGSLNLYLRHYLDSRIQGSNSLTAGINGTKEYFLAEDLYFSKGRTQVNKLKTSKKKMGQLFEARKEKVENFMKEHNLKYNSKEELIRIFDFYNGLVKNQDRQVDTISK